MDKHEVLIEQVDSLEVQYTSVPVLKLFIWYKGLMFTPLNLQ